MANTLECSVFGSHLNQNQFRRINYAFISVVIKDMDLPRLQDQPEVNVCDVLTAFLSERTDPASLVIHVPGNLLPTIQPNQPNRIQSI